MSLALHVGVEIAVAKAVDYAGSSVSRLPDSPNEPFYASMARLGLQQGWEGSGKALPWWYGAISAGMTGSTDFIAGQVLGSLIRTQVKQAIEREPALKEALGGTLPSFEQVLAALRGETPPGLAPARAQELMSRVQALLTEGDGAIIKKLLDGAPGVELKAPVTRHLRMALVDTGQSEFAGFVERNLLGERPLKGGALGGSVIGHGVAGAVTGLMTGHPALGAVVTLLDSLTEGLLAQKAISGKYEALTTIKCAMLLKGIREAETPPDWRGRLGNRLMGYYSQMSEEVRLFGEDLFHLAQAADVLAEDKLPKLNAELAELIGAQVAEASPAGEAPTPNQPRTAVRGYATEQARQVLDVQGASVTNLVRAQVRAARSEIEHHASTNLGSALAHDFAEERARLDARLGELKADAASKLTEVLKAHPKLQAFLNRPHTDTAEMSRLASFARSIVKRGVALASGAVHVGRTAAGKAAHAVHKVGDTRAAQALGKTILHLARLVELELMVPVGISLEQARDAAKGAAFAVMKSGGKVAVTGLLAGERWAKKNAQELRDLGDAISQVRERLGEQGLAALEVMQRSASAGAAALANMILMATGSYTTAELAAFELNRQLQGAAGPGAS